MTTKTKSNGRKAKAWVHVNQHKIRANSKLPDNATPEPVLTVKQGKQNTYCFEVEFEGKTKFVYSPDKPKSCGAKVWAETDGNVKIIK
tara:strand:+ start:108 stop:371 length:264 start_codon:yes stop_codon:yes gene_type:complete